MIGALLSGIWPYLAGFVALIGAALGWAASIKRNAKRQTALEAAEDIAKRERKGREAVADEKRATDGADNRDLLDRLRRRDGDWRGL